MAPLLKKMQDDEDLNWADENIPKSLGDMNDHPVDTMLNTFIPSDEEQELKQKEIEKLN